MNYVAIIGTGFVADLYMKSLAVFPNVDVRIAFDLDPGRRRAFTSHWKVPLAETFEDFLAATSTSDLILNLTNPRSHYAVSKACLEAGRHVYSEKPLAMSMEQAFDLYNIAAERNLCLASAPCSLLGEAAQTAWRALRDGMIGAPLLVYAELDDGFISQAPYQFWRSESGAPWPYDDEFRVGCTIEHAGYYLSWLIAMFGSVRTVVAASAELDRGKPTGTDGAPDFSVATLFFESGVVARLTCSILARHNHSMMIVGETGTIEIGECWDNSAPVRIRRRKALRRRLVEWPLARRFKVRGPTHPKVPRTGSASMNFALGPMEMLEAIGADRPPQMSADLALHLNEVTLAIQNAGHTTGAIAMKTRCPPIPPAPWATKG